MLLILYAVSQTYNKWPRAYAMVIKIKYLLKPIKNAPIKYDIKSEYE